jgi:polar amino acid transport system substrate-binding protein
MIKYNSVVMKTDKRLEDIIMKKGLRIIGIIMAITIMFLTGCGKTSTNTSSQKSTNGNEKFIVGLDDNFPPMGFRNEKGEIVGFDIDLATEAAKRMGMTVEFKPVDWDGITMSLKNKDIDVIWNGLTITDKRKQQINFTKAYLQNKQIIVVKEGSKISKKSDLSGMVVGIQMGSSSEEALNSDKDLVKSLKDVRKFADNTQALLDLKNGGIDAVVVDEVVGRYYISKKPGEYKVLDEDLGKEEYGVGVRKEDKDFLEKLDKAIDDMKKDGTADKISEKWFGKGIVAK